MNNSKPVLIAVPTNDGTTVFPKMLGMASSFYIYETLDSKQFTLAERRGNPYETTMQHLKTLDVYTVISDCEVIVPASIGKKGIERLKAKGVKLFFRKGKINETLKSVFKNGTDA